MGVEVSKIAVNTNVPLLGSKYMLVLLIIVISVGIFLKYSNEIGKFIGKNKVTFIALLSLVVIGSVTKISYENNIENEKERAKKEKESILWSARQFSYDDCLKNASAISEDFLKRTKENPADDQETINTINLYMNCISKLRRNKAWESVDKYIDNYYQSKIENRSMPFGAIPIMKAMRTIEPENTNNKNQLKQLEVQFTSHQKKEELDNLRRVKAAETAERKRKKSRGVTIGMSREDVLASSWGRPEKVNKTTNQYGTSEQWVYPGGYLYFEDGTLTTIQN